MAAPGPGRDASRCRQRKLSFVPVVGAAGPLSAETSAAPAGRIEVALGGAVVRVPPEVDGRLLAKVLRAMKSVA